MYYLDTNKKILVEVSARGGNNTVAQWFTGNNISNFSYKNRILTNVPLHYMQDESYIKIKFVRNPYKRVVSSYIKPYRKKTNTKSFFDFLKFLSSGNNINSDIHYNVQRSSYDDMFNTICKVDDIVDVKNTFSQVFDVQSMTIINLHETTKLACEDGQFIHHTDWDEKSWVDSQSYTASNRHVPDYNGFFSAETLTLINKIYKQDIDAYDYQAPHIV